MKEFPDDPVVLADPPEPDEPEGPELPPPDAADAAISGIEPKGFSNPFRRGCVIVAGVMPKAPAGA
jgi:hypothetical protein